MKVGDVVMFVDEGRYAKWFFGQVGEVTSYSASKISGKGHCRVKWLKPIKYHDTYTEISDFSADMFSGGTGENEDKHESR